MSTDKIVQKSCNCRNSKCTKLYCQCYAARLQCNKNCHCIDCHNRHTNETFKMYKQYNPSGRKSFKDEQQFQQIRIDRGCACRKSNCTKRYCQCYQAGLLCKDHCKCVDCQNNQSLSNKKLITDLKNSNHNTNNNTGNGLQKQALYPILLSQNPNHLETIIADENPFKLEQQWLQQCTETIINRTKQINNKQTIHEKIIQTFLGYLNEIQKKISDIDEEPQLQLNLQYD